MICTTVRYHEGCALLSVSSGVPCRSWTFDELLHADDDDDDDDDDDVMDIEQTHHLAPDERVE